MYNIRSIVDSKIVIQKIAPAFQTKNESYLHFQQFSEFLALSA